MNATRSGVGALNVAIAGAGVIAATAHRDAWKSQRGARVRLVVDRHADRAERLARELGAEWSDDLSMLEARGDIDAVDVCLPPHTHADLVTRLVRAGKHVLVEKPLTTTLADALRVADVAAASGPIVMVAENWPFASAARRVARLVEHSRLGELFMLRAHHESGLYVRRADDSRSWVGSPVLAGGGYLFDAGVHAINLARRFMGEFATIVALSTPDLAGGDDVVEDDVALVGRFESDALATMNFTGRSRRAGPRKLALVLFGTKGVAELDILTGRVVLSTPRGEAHVADVPPSMGFSEEIRHFVDCVASGRQPATSASDQVLTIAAVAAAYESMRSGGAASPRALIERERLTLARSNG